jgi:hypothetical protein
LGSADPNEYTLLCPCLAITILFEISDTENCSFATEIKIKKVVVDILVS